MTSKAELTPEQQAIKERKLAERRRLRSLSGRAEGRPTTYEPRIALEICQRIARGDHLTKICRTWYMPNRTTVWKWRRQNPSFANAFSRAKEMAAESWEDQAFEIADEVEPDHGHVAKAKLRVDLRMKLMGMHNRATYGNRVDVKHGGSIEHALDFGTILPEAPVQAEASIDAPETPANGLPEPTRDESSVTPPPEEAAESAQTSAEKPAEEDGEAWPSTMPGEFVLEQPAKPEELHDDDQGREAGEG